MEEHEIFFSLAVAAAAGLLVGLERERSAGAGHARGPSPVERGPIRSSRSPGRSRRCSRDPSGPPRSRSRSSRSWRSRVFVVLVAAVDFVGYVAIRLLGADRGLGLTGLAGGLASSTAVTLSMSARAKEDPAATTGCLLAVLLAGSVSSVRVLGLVAVAGPHLLGAVAWHIGAMAVAGLAPCALVHARARPAATARTSTSRTRSSSRPR